MASLELIFMSDEETDPDMPGQLLLRSPTWCSSRLNELLPTLDQQEVEEAGEGRPTAAPSPRDRNQSGFHRP